MLELAERAQSQLHAHVEDPDGGGAEDCVDRWERELFDVLELGVSFVGSVRLDAAGHHCVEGHEHHCFERKDVLELGADLENGDPEEVLHDTEREVHVVELGADVLQVLQRLAEVFVVLVLVGVLLVEHLPVDQQLEVEGSVSDEQQVRGGDVEDVREEGLRLQQVVVLVHQDPLERVALVELALLHLLEGLEDHAVDYVHDHGDDLEVEDGDLRFSVPVVVVDVPQLGLEQAVAVFLFLLVLHAPREDPSRNIIVNVVVFVDTSLPVLAQEVVVLLGLDVQDPEDVEHDVGELEDFFHIKCRIGAEKSFGV